MLLSFPASVLHGAQLNLSHVTRDHTADYICVASNGIPPDETISTKLVIACESSWGSVGNPERSNRSENGWSRIEIMKKIKFRENKD